MKKHLFLNIGILFWSTALVTWVYGAKLTAIYFALFTALLFTLHILKWSNIMFKKNKSLGTNQAIINKNEQINDKEKPSIIIERPVATGEKPATTVIASGVHFDGNIIACGHVYIYGSLTGNIDAKGNLIKIMREGMVEGNVTCRELIVDGYINGHCTSDSLEICENGQVIGNIAYGSLMIKKGGELSGQSEVLQQEKEPSNVVDIVKECINEEEGKSSKMMKKGSSEEDIST